MRMSSDRSEVSSAAEPSQKNPERFGLIPMLQQVQVREGYLSAEALRLVAQTLSLPLARVVSTATFYSQFRLKPCGKHIVRVCTGTACHVKGAERLVSAFRQTLSIASHEDTDETKTFTVEKVGCLGCCVLAPAVQIDGVIFGHVRPDTVRQTLDHFLQQKNRQAGSASDFEDEEKKRAEQDVSAANVRGRLSICTCASCRAAGAEDVYRRLKDESVSRGFVVQETGCSGWSFAAPLLVIEQGETMTRFANVQDDPLLLSLLDRMFPKMNPVARVMRSAVRVLDVALTGKTSMQTNSISCEFEKAQQPWSSVLLQRMQNVSPVDLSAYQREGGFDGLKKCLQEQRPEDWTGIIEKSGLRGRGGGGFPAAEKWRQVWLARQNVADTGETVNSVVIANGDEGDPGAFMDRTLMESFPFGILEGMLIAAYCTGATRGYIYIRAEYPLALARIRQALQSCQRAGLLGEKILGSDFSCEIEIVSGAGAFVCGEETALISSIEGRRGMPTLKPPYPSQSGLYGLPTLVQNVETLANVALIIRQGAEVFQQQGTEKSPGTKLFALAGKVKRGGLIEAPMGVTISDIVEGWGGGAEDGQTLKAVQIGGPSGGVLPVSHFNTPVTYEALREAGAMMGSGGMVVLDGRDCMVEIARYFLSFTQKESCGRCAPCRIGTRRMLDILERLCAGTAKPEELQQLKDLALMVKKTSLCGLGQTAANPVLSAMRFFADEFEAHTRGRCPAHSCKALIKYRITENCIGCLQCARACPVGAISGNAHEKQRIDPDLCLRCGGCSAVCPENAVEVTDADA